MSKLLRLSRFEEDAMQHVITLFSYCFSLLLVQSTNLSTNPPGVVAFLCFVFLLMTGSGHLLVSRLHSNALLSLHYSPLWHPWPRFWSVSFFTLVFLCCHTYGWLSKVCKFLPHNITILTITSLVSLAESFLATVSWLSFRTCVIFSCRVYLELVAEADILRIFFRATERLLCLKTVQLRLAPITTWRRRRRRAVRF